MSTSDLSPIEQCRNCGADLSPGARFCANCGEEVLSEKTEPSTPEPIYWSDSPSNSEWRTPAPEPVPGAYVPVTGMSVERSGGIGKLFSANGRIGRMEYFLTLLGIWAVLIVTWGVVIGADTPLVTIALGFTSLFACVGVAICAGVKRLHDIGQTGWLYLIFLIPMVSFVFLLFLLLKGPDSTHNIYGFEGSGSLKG